MARIDKERLQPVNLSRKGLLELSAGVTPLFGANLVSLKVAGTELIFWDQTGLLAGKSHTGAFNMFPTPCRLDKCSYTFGKRHIRQRKHGQDIFIHGLVRDEPFAFQAESDRITSWLDIAPGHPIFGGFPFKCRFQVSHVMEEDGMTIGFEVANRDSRAIPFGYGVHPFWRIIGGRKDIALRIPCPYLLDMANLVPTGGYSPVGALDLRVPRTLEGFHCDNVFWPRKLKDTAEIVMAKPGLKIQISASANFPHMIVYAPPGKKFVCVENLTSAPNAPNLAAAGHAKVAGMLVAKPGQTVKGWIRYTITRVANN